MDRERTVSRIFFLNGKLADRRTHFNQFCVSVCMCKCVYAFFCLRRERCISPTSACLNHLLTLLRTCKRWRLARRLQPCAMIGAGEAGSFELLEWGEHCWSHIAGPRSQNAKFRFRSGDGWKRKLCTNNRATFVFKRFIHSWVFNWQINKQTC